MAKTNIVLTVLAVFAVCLFLVSASHAQTPADAEYYPTGGTNYVNTLPTYYLGGSPTVKFNNPYEAALWNTHTNNNYDGVDGQLVTVDSYQGYYSGDSTFRYTLRIRQYANGVLDTEYTQTLPVQSYDGAEYPANSQCVTVDGRAESNFGDYETDVCPWYPATQCQSGEIYWWSTQTCVPEDCDGEDRLLDGSCGNPCDSQDFYYSYSCDPDNTSLFDCPPPTSMCLATANVFVCDDNECSGGLQNNTPGCVFDFNGTYTTYNFTDQFGEPDSFRIYTGVRDVDENACSSESVQNDPCVIFATDGQCGLRQSEIDAYNEDQEVEPGYDQPTENNANYWCPISCDTSGQGFSPEHCTHLGCTQYSSNFQDDTPGPVSSSRDSQSGFPNYSGRLNAVCDMSYDFYDQSMCHANSEDTYTSGGQHGEPYDPPDIGINPGTGDYDACDGTNDGDCFCSTDPMSPDGSTDTWGGLCDAYNNGGAGDQETEGGSGQEGGGSGGGAGTATSDAINAKLDEIFPEEGEYPTEGNVPESQYPDGLAGAFDDANEATDDSALQQWLDGFEVVLPSDVPQCPSFEFVVPVTGTVLTFEPPCEVWDMIANVMLAMTVLASYAIIVGRG